MRPRLLDLFCGAGGAGMGYHRAGFDVVGVDIVPQPHYPFEFIQDDALECIEDADLEYQAIHASPPCQFFSLMSNRARGRGGLADERVDLLTPTLALIRSLPIPYVVENVVGSAPPLKPTISLHGGMFGLGVVRTRLFESNVVLMSAAFPIPVKRIGVYGRAPDGRRLWGIHPNSEFRAAASLKEAQDAMGMDWGDWHGVKEAIPPAYTEWIGAQLLAALAAHDAARTGEGL